jgi:hypothetical protein
MALRNELYERALELWQEGVQMCMQVRVCIYVCVSVASVYMRGGGHWARMECVRGAHILISVSKLSQISL